MFRPSTAAITRYEMTGSASLGPSELSCGGAVAPERSIQSVVNHPRKSLDGLTVACPLKIFGSLPFRPFSPVSLNSSPEIPLLPFNDRVPPTDFSLFTSQQLSVSISLEARRAGPGTVISNPRDDGFQRRLQ